MRARTPRQGPGWGLSPALSARKPASGRFWPAYGAAGVTGPTGSRRADGGQSRPLARWRWRQKDARGLLLRPALGLRSADGPGFFEAVAVMGGLYARAEGHAKRQPAAPRLAQEPRLGRRAIRGPEGKKAAYGRLWPPVRPPQPMRAWARSIALRVASRARSASAALASNRRR